MCFAVNCTPLRRAEATIDSLYRLLRQCKSLAGGRQVQHLIHQNGFAHDQFLAAHLIRMFTFFKSLPEAQEVFSNLSNPSAFVWSTIISAHSNLGDLNQAFHLYTQMQKQPDSIPNEFVFASVLKACAKTAKLYLCRWIHAHVIESGLETKIIVINTLVDAYGKCAELDDAFNIFSLTPVRDMVTWNALVAAYCYNKHVDQAVVLFEHMRAEGLQPDHATWNSLIGAFVFQGKHEVALMLFSMMVMEGICPSQATFVNIMLGCSSRASVEQGKMVHVQILETDFRLDHVVGSSLIDMYAKFERLESARSVFDGAKQKDIVTWNAMIAGYARNGYGHLAFQLFVEMQEVGINPDKYTYVSAVKACTLVGALNQGRLVHYLVVKGGIELDVYAGSALIDMYCKWHRLKDGSQVFEALPEPNIVTWNAILSGYAQHKYFKEALRLFERMKRKGIRPDAVTFLCLLSACGQEALVEQASDYLKSMSAVHGIKPCCNHSNCMLDILGRIGCLDEAVHQIEKTSPCLLQDTTWRSLLSHCKTHGNLELGKQCFDKVTSSDQSDSASFVLMSQLCADAGEWEEAIILEEERRCLHAQKKPGMAFIEIDNQVHHFLAGDLSYPAKGKPVFKTKRLKGIMLQEGYMPSLDLVLH